MSFQAAFDTFGYSLLKTMVMSTGEYEYEGIFVGDDPVSVFILQFNFFFSKYIKLLSYSPINSEQFAITIYLSTLIYTKCCILTLKRCDQEKFILALIYRDPS